MLSTKVKEELLESQSHLRAALKNAAVNEKPFVCKQLSDIIYALDSLEKTEMMIDNIETRKFGDSGMSGTFLRE